MWPRATDWTPMSQGLCKNNAVIALIFTCPAQIALWFLMWTIRILILEAMNIIYLLGWFCSVHIILSETQKGAYIFIYGNAPGLENILQYTATYFLHLVGKPHISKGKLLIYILKGVSCHILHTYLCELVQFFSSHWTCSHKLWCTRN